MWFFFSSRRRHTRCLSDWSSDVCSSDLQKIGWAQLIAASGMAAVAFDIRSDGVLQSPSDPSHDVAAALAYVRAHVGRSEERRVGKSVDLGGRRLMQLKAM